MYIYIYIYTYSYILYRDPMQSSNFLHRCPWIRDISYRELFGEKTSMSCPVHEVAMGLACKI